MGRPMNADTATPERRHAAATPRVSRAAVAALLLAIALCLAPLHDARAQAEDRLPSRQLEGIDIVENLGETIPRDLVFLNSDGEQVEIGDYLDEGKPVVINLLYFGCPMLCHLATQGMVTVLGDLAWAPGEEFTVLTVSFDPSEKPPIADRYRGASLAALGRDGAADGWHFLTGEQAEITALTDALGFRYQWVEEKGEFAHASALILVTPEGRISRYLHGVHYDATTLRRALVEASEGRIGTIVDQVLWRCLAYDPDAGEYILAAWTILRIGGLLTLVTLVAAVGSLWFLEFRRKKTATHP